MTGDGRCSAIEGGRREWIERLGGQHPCRQEVRSRKADVARPTWHLYVVRTRDGCLYTGIATDVRRRLAEHGEAGPKGAKFLRGRGPLRLEFQRRIGSLKLALKVERRIKGLAKPLKERLVRSRPGKRRLLDQLGLVEDDG